MAEALPGLRRDVPLAPLTTLGIGGAAACFLDAPDPATAGEALAWARTEGLPVFVLGGGSNILVSDAGWPGLVLRIRDERCSFAPDGDAVLARVGAGLDWDALVAVTTEMDLAGLECTSGIPGFVGGAPIQNVGAYGQEVAETIAAVHVLDRQTGEQCELASEDCGFSYRDSRFKGEWAERYLVTQVDFLLQRGGEPTLRYPELQQHAESRASGAPTLALVRELVLELRRRKAMVVDPTDPNTRSAGSFFTNPQLSPDELTQLEAELERAEVDPAQLPRYPAPGDLTKVPAAWLIEQAGFHKGYALGPAAISSRHSLALVNRGGARATDILALAGRVRGGVQERFGVSLEPEPRFIGFAAGAADLLAAGTEKG